MSRPSEWDDVSCKNMPAEIFFDREYIATAKQYCAKCPKQEECLQYALDNNEEFGVWGGMAEEERSRLRKKLKREQQELHHKLAS